MAEAGGRTKCCAIGVNAPMNKLAAMQEPFVPEERRSTALDPDLLTAEIGLLLDYLSGLPERILTPHQQGHLPLGCATYDEALARYFPIDEKVRRGETLPPSDLQFLLELRDYLNACAEPATGASIAFTTLVMRKLPEARKGKADAERAYPEWVPMARALSRTMMAMLCLAVFITLSIATLAAYIYLGNAKVANLTDIKAHFKSLDEEILREEVEVYRPPNAAVLPYCADVDSVQDPVNPGGKLEGFHTIAQSHLCAQIQRFAAKAGPSLRESVAALVPARRSRAARPAQRCERLRAARPDGPARFNDLCSTALPAQRRRSSPYPDATLREYIVRLVLGTVFGVAIGFFTSASGNASEQVIANPVSSLGAPALAFLAGYGVEAVFRMLDGLAEHFSSARK